MAQTSGQWKQEQNAVPITDILHSSAELACAVPIPPDITKLSKEICEACIDAETLHNVQDCQEFFVNLHSEPSNAIHGASWSGPGVKNTLLKVPNAMDHICVVAPVCDCKFNLVLG